MKKLWGSTIVVLIVAFSVPSLSWAVPAEADSALVEVGNKICPVSGEPVGKMGKIEQIEYNGKLYNLCCPMCAKDFKKDPEKYSKIAEASEKIETKDEGMMHHGKEGSSEEHEMQGMHGEDLEHSHSH